MTSVYSYSNLGHFGACGNQLFQIASTIGIALDNGGRPSFPRWEYQPYFSVPSEFFDGQEGIDRPGEYLQDLKYFGKYFPLIKKYFSPSDYSEQYINQNYYEVFYKKHFFTKLIAVHVRRANNVYLPDHHPVCPIEYYEKAIDLVLADQPSGFDHQLMVFSDDIEWCKEQLVFKNAIFANGNKPDIDPMRLTDAHPLALGSAAFDLLTMAKCEYHIISNSTFSWWGAMLGSSSIKTVYPDPWYGPALQHIDVKNTIIPSYWKGVHR